MLWSLLLCAAEAALPSGPIIAAWSSWGSCNETENLLAAQRGVNVIFWFAGNLVTKGAEPRIQAPDTACVRATRQRLEDLGLQTVHLMTFGGWNAPHPSDAFTGGQCFEVWDRWNHEHGRLFDGFDWDLEGHDNVVSRLNVMSPKEMQLLVDMSVAAKKAEYVVTMAPPESYFDMTMGAFNRYMNNSNKEFFDFHPDFQYRGRNLYAYWWQRAPPGTFNLISVQLYETYSPALRALSSGQTAESYAKELARRFNAGWSINFDDPLLPLQGSVFVRPENLLLGVSFLGPPKSAFFWPQELGRAYEAAPMEERPRGYAFWLIALEDTMAPRGPNATRRLSFAKELNDFLHVRPQGLQRRVSDVVAV